MKPFSLISNLDRLLKPSESDEFSIINGFKVCAILQVIVGHRWFIEFGNPQMNPNEVHWVCEMHYKYISIKGLFFSITLVICFRLFIMYGWDTLNVPYFWKHFL